jgi:hypothetical protein
MAQSVPVQHIELNIPFRCIRTNELYILPEWLPQMDKMIRVFRTEDYGPITKVAETFLPHRDDRETYIWSVDDDCAYPSNQLELLVQAHDPRKRRILTRHGGKINDDGTVDFWYGEADVCMFEGLGGVLYPPACIGDDFLEYVITTSQNEHCRRCDDMVLSVYFRSNGIPIHLYKALTRDPIHALRMAASGRN